MAVFASRGVPLLRLDEWPHRPEDRVWQQKIIDQLRMTHHPRMEDHVSAVEKELGCARFRPEEVAAAGTSTELPAGFEYAERVGQKIVDRLRTE
jgi:hypothetical protein